MTDNAAVMSVLARCLIVPGFIDAIGADRKATLKQCGVSDDTLSQFGNLDLDRLRLFSGFITRVKHNFLWDAIPRTLKLLRLDGCELRIFSSYAEVFNKGSKRPTRDERARAFINYLVDLLRTEPCFARLEYTRCVLEHESTLWVLDRDRAAPRKQLVRFMLPRQLTVKSYERVRPILRGDIRLRTFKVDPVAASDNKDRQSEQISEASRLHHLYWAPPDGSPVTFIPISIEMETILRSADGNLSLKAILENSAELCHHKLRSVLREVNRLEDVGVLDLLGVWH